MRQKIYLTVFTSILFINIMCAQQFITRATIEYEVKSNIQKTMGNDVFAEMIKENLPTFKTGYYLYTFAGDKSVYKFDRWEPNLKLPDFLKKSDEENLWYYDFSRNKFNIQKNIYGSNINVEDTLKPLEWRLTNESRVIAGFNCRKAVAKIFDSVYVFALYTDEILISGGPCSINGLPGMILGLTIPRLFTSWIATKVTVTGVNESLIKPIDIKKNFTMQSFKATVYDRIKDWTTEDNNDDERQQKNRFVWNLLL